MTDNAKFQADRAGLPVEETHSFPGTGGSATSERKSEAKAEKLFMRNFFRKTGKAIYDYGMIASGDKILVGVSGGKDSLALLEVLALRARDPKQDYTVAAAHIAGRCWRRR